ncbi:bifunctional 3-(3-hydroxy-phenyl)propionate/3-hydroxycinnamic acid hydroxylase [uncultured Modestobacter sp.]|uniref:bifunctional 3-(3-hydroxy-phenyl)propionate/3-hydroxycinnamic acid hydroxylase n=1 Tax=uncultured Modestobacter sp. TaxID=380048 RepID=UPI002622931D|nr:bifunctional 3-(3-hydroxy-phenyl)propionate/3-hydroxycinnamic acid hydroxylase [uncultured Modestobacter sp.]
MDLTTDVAIVGAGPCGTTLANLLGGNGVRTVLLDQEEDIYPHPRAVAVDDESLRTFQTSGLTGELMPDVIQNAPIRYYSSSGRRLAHVRPSGQPYGWPRRNLFYQPLMEAVLRRGLERYDHVQLLTGTTVTGLQQDPEGVELTATGAAGEATRVRARYVVGADGGRSFVRGAVGIELTGTTAPTRWLVVDVENDTWDAPFSAVYCDPDRPAMTIPLPYGRRRFEFKLLPAEDEDAVVADDVVNGLLAEYYRGLPLPTILRRRVYWHHSRIASTFQSGSVFLAGDAAHLQPPFFGQGMNSGIRDATNLGWKLAAVTAGQADPRLLASYDAERRGTAEAMVSFATRVGNMYQPRNRATEMVRDVVFRGVQHVPGAREYILQMKYKPAPRYTEGIVLHPAQKDAASLVGRAFPQPSVETADRARVKLDDAVGGSFAILGLTGDPLAALSAESQKYWTELGARFVRVSPSRTGLRSPADDRAVALSGASLVVYDVDGAFRDHLLERPGDEVVVLRPDRYVAATCRPAELELVTRELRAMITGQPVAASG